MSLPRPVIITCATLSRTLIQTSTIWLYRSPSVMTPWLYSFSTRSTSCCALPSLQTRLRIEYPKGLVRPYGEAAVALLWPDGAPDVVTFGAEGGGGVLFVPGAARRMGVGLGVMAGNVARIGPYVKLRVGAEVRF